MKKQISLKKTTGKAGMVIVFAGICLLASSWTVTLQTVSGLKAGAFPADTTVSAFIGSYLNNAGNTLKLYYPNAVRRFYASINGGPAWIKPEKQAGKTWEAMLLLDCVNQYGLNHADYHPAELPYDRLHTMIEKPANIRNSEKARFDIILTDALITLSNNLHYGKLNPDYGADALDADGPLPFRADSALAAAFRQQDFRDAVLRAQPQDEQYKNMQYEMHLLKGVYQGDCYQIPDSEVRKVAINMERLRWAAINTQTYLQVNIPSFTLQFHRPDSIYAFKVIVGKTIAPTPQLNSAITYMTTSPEWAVPRRIFVKEILPKALKNASYLENSHFTIYDRKGNYVSPTRAALQAISRHPAGYYARQSSGCDNALGRVVFRFQNPYSIYLHDTPEQQLFKQSVRAFSHSCIRVERASEVAELLLKSSGTEDKIHFFRKAMKANQTRNISLKSPVPLKITYLTCTVQKGEVIYFPDIYQLDKRLEMALYNATPQQLSMR